MKILVLKRSSQLLLVILLLTTLFSCSGGVNQSLSTDSSGSTTTTASLGSVAGNPGDTVVITQPRTIANPSPNNLLFFQPDGSTSEQTIIDPAVVPDLLAEPDFVPPIAVFKAQHNAATFLSLLRSWGHIVELILNENNILYPLINSFTFEMARTPPGLGLGDGLDINLMQIEDELKMDMAGERGKGIYLIRPSFYLFGGKQMVGARSGVLLIVDTQEGNTKSRDVLTSVVFDTSNKDKVRLARQSLHYDGESGLYHPHRLLIECNSQAFCLSEYQTLDATDQLVAYRFSRQKGADTLCIASVTYTAEGSAVGAPVLFDRKSQTSLHQSCTIDSSTLSWASTILSADSFFSKESFAEFQNNLDTAVSLEMIEPWLRGE